MARPEVSAAAEELYEALEPAFTVGDSDETGWPALNLCEALVAGDVARIHSYVIDRDDGTPGWAILLDPENAPAEALPWLAQFTGAVLLPSMSEEQMRATIAFPESFERGGPGALVSVARRRLTGSKTVLVDERYQGSAYRLRVRTLLAETPDPALTEAEIRAEQKPIGVVLTYEAIETQDWLDLRSDHATWADVMADYDDWLEVRTELP